MKKKLSIPFLVLWLFAGQSNVFAQNNVIGNQIKGNLPVKVYLGNFINSTSQSPATPESYKKSVAESLLGRKSLKFEVVNNPNESQIQIVANIKQYQYLEKGPMKVVPSAGFMVMDAIQTATGNYVEMEVEFTVTDAKTNKVLWKDTISSYLKKPMTPQESTPLIYDKVTKGFFKKCFGKPK